MVFRVFRLNLQNIYLLKYVPDYDRSDGGGESFKTRGSARHGHQNIPSHSTESSSYTIRMTSLSRHRPSAEDITATTSSAPKTFAYIMPSTSASANVANGVAGSEGDYYLIPRLSDPSTEQSAAGQSVDRVRLFYHTFQI